MKWHISVIEYFVFIYQNSHLIAILTYVRFLLSFFLAHCLKRKIITIPNPFQILIYISCFQFFYIFSCCLLKTVQTEFFISQRCEYWSPKYFFSGFLLQIFNKFLVNSVLMLDHTIKESDFLLVESL